MMLGAAAMVLASCTNEEVLNVADSRAIGFSSFVGNNTRADITNDAFLEFIVYGGYDATTPIFDKVKVTNSGSDWTYTPPQYWVAGETYKFAAYAPADDGITASWNHNTGLTLNVNSDMSNQNDLIYAAADNVSADEHIQNQSAVALEFSHLLSKVSFKFIKEDASLGAQKVEMSNFQVSDINTKSTWTAGGQGASDTPGDYTDFADAEEIDGTDGLTTDAFYVIPQNIGTFSITANVKVTDAAGTVIKEGIITATVPTTGITEWAAQNVYVYTAEITMSNIDDEDPDTPEPTPIVFSGSVDDTWTSGSGNITVDVPSDQGN